MKPEEIVHLPKIETCLQDVKSWMANNFLLLNSDKTEVMLVGPKQLRMTSSHLPTLDGISLTSNTSIKNLCVIINQDLLLDSHIKQISKTIIFSSTQYWSYPSKIEKSTFIMLRLDYCNALLSGCSNNSNSNLHRMLLLTTLTRTHLYFLLCTGSLSKVQWISKYSF